MPPSSVWLLAPLRAAWRRPLTASRRRGTSLSTSRSYARGIEGESRGDGETGDRETIMRERRYSTAGNAETRSVIAPPGLVGQRTQKHRLLSPTDAYLWAPAVVGFCGVYFASPLSPPRLASRLLFSSSRLAFYSSPTLTSSSHVVHPHPGPYPGQHQPPRPCRPIRRAR
jgi:hypothetical protein